LLELTAENPVEDLGSDKAAEIMGEARALAEDIKMAAELKLLRGEAENPREALAKNSEAYDAHINEIIAELAQDLDEAEQAETLTEGQADGFGDIIAKLQEVLGPDVDMQKKEKMIAVIAHAYAQSEMLEAENPCEAPAKNFQAYDACINDIIASLAQAINEADEAESLTKAEAVGFVQIVTKLREVLGSDVDIQKKEKMIAMIAMFDQAFAQSEIFTEAEVKDVFAQSAMVMEAEAEAKIALLAGAEAEMLTEAETKIAEVEAEILTEA